MFQCVGLLTSLCPRPRLPYCCIEGDCLDENSVVALSKYVFRGRLRAF